MYEVNFPFSQKFEGLDYLMVFTITNHRLFLLPTNNHISINHYVELKKKSCHVFNSKVGQDIQFLQEISHLPFKYYLISWIPNSNFIKGIK